MRHVGLFRMANSTNISRLGLTNLSHVPPYFYCTDYCWPYITSMFPTVVTDAGFQDQGVDPASDTCSGNNVQGRGHRWEQVSGCLTQL